MKKINGIILNLYDENALERLLNHLIKKEFKSFISVCAESAFRFKNEDQKKDARYLQWNLPPDLKEHPYAEAMILMADLNQVRESE